MTFLGSFINLFVKIFLVSLPWINEWKLWNKLFFILLKLVHPAKHRYQFFYNIFFWLNLIDNKIQRCSLFIYDNLFYLIQFTRIESMLFLLHRTIYFIWLHSQEAKTYMIVWAVDDDRDRRKNVRHYRCRRKKMVLT